MIKGREYVYKYNNEVEIGKYQGEIKENNKTFVMLGNRKIKMAEIDSMLDKGLIQSEETFLESINFYTPKELRNAINQVKTNLLIEAEMFYQKEIEPKFGRMIDQKEYMQLLYNASKLCLDLTYGSENVAFIEDFNSSNSLLRAADDIKYFKPKFNLIYSNMLNYSVAGKCEEGDVELSMIAYHYSCITDVKIALKDEIILKEVKKLFSPFVEVDKDIINSYIEEELTWKGFAKRINPFEIDKKHKEAK